jgi:hypothetical protein
VVEKQQNREQLRSALQSGIPETVPYFMTDSKVARVIWDILPELCDGQSQKKTLNRVLL